MTLAGLLRAHLATALLPTFLWTFVPGSTLHGYLNIDCPLVKKEEYWKKDIRVK